MSDFSVSKESQKELLKLAREAIAAYLQNQKVIDFSAKNNKELSAHAAVFVTLTQSGALRGCIGTTEPLYPLYEAVIKMALSAAFNDSRFYPLTAEELSKTKIEISVLSPMIKVKSADDIIPDKHGVLIQKGNRSGLFLPQVWKHFANKVGGNAAEDDRKTKFLNELCSQKAGLPSDSWKNKETDIYVFTVFSLEE